MISKALFEKLHTGYLNKEIKVQFNQHESEGKLIKILGDWLEIKCNDDEEPELINITNAISIWRT